MNNETPIDPLEAVRKFYRAKIEKYGIRDLGQSVGWSSQKRALECYVYSLSYPEQRWHEFEEVLDIGSGHGNLLPILRKEKSFSGTYTGVELLPEFHQSAVEQFKEDSQAVWICGDFLTCKFGDKQFDWVISLGSFSVKSLQQEQRDLATLQKISQLAKYGFTIYLNDVEQMRPGRLEEVPDLAVHNISEFVDRIEKVTKVIKIEVSHFPEPTSQGTMVHTVLAKPEISR